MNNSRRLASNKQTHTRGLNKQKCQLEKNVCFCSAVVRDASLRLPIGHELQNVVVVCSMIGCCCCCCRCDWPEQLVHVSGGMFVRLPPDRDGFEWSWNFLLSHRYRVSGMDLFQDRLLADFRRFCNAQDNRLQCLLKQLLQLQFYIVYYFVLVCFMLVTMYI